MLAPCTNTLKPRWKPLPSLRGGEVPTVRRTESWSTPRGVHEEASAVWRADRELCLVGEHRKDIRAWSQQALELSDGMDDSSRSSIYGLQRRTWGKNFDTSYTVRLGVWGIWKGCCSIWLECKDSVDDLNMNEKTSQTTHFPSCKLHFFLLILYFEIFDFKIRTILLENVLRPISSSPGNIWHQHHLKNLKNSWQSEQNLVPFHQSLSRISCSSIWAIQHTFFLSLRLTIWHVSAHVPERRRREYSSTHPHTMTVQNIVDSHLLLSCASDR